MSTASRPFGLELTTSSTKGRFSPKTDEWCFTYCSQSINGRIHSKEPYCRSFCIRKVFTHEVRNVLSFKSHRSIGADGKAKYPLPSEGQPQNVPKLLGGEQGDDPDEELNQRKPQSTKYWDEGWYLWMGKSRWAIQERTETMLLDLEQQQRMETLKELKKKEAAMDKNKLANEREGARRKTWGYVVPRYSTSDIRYAAQVLFIA